MFDFGDYYIALIIYAVEMAILGFRILKRVFIIKDSYAIAISGLIIPWTISYFANPIVTLVPKIIISTIIIFFLWLLFYISKFYTLYIIWNADKTSIESWIESILIKNSFSYQKKSNEFILKELDMSIGYYQGRYSEQKIYIRSSKKNRLAFDTIDQELYLFFKNKKADKLSHDGIAFIVIAIFLLVLSITKFR